MSEVRVVDLEKPMHFTKEQSEWIKAYVIVKKQEARAEVIDELFNAETINGMTLKDVYEEAPINEFDEGWNRCYEDFVEVAEQLKFKDGGKE